MMFYVDGMGTTLANAQLQAGIDARQFVEYTFVEHYVDRQFVERHHVEIFWVEEHIW